MKFYFKTDANKHIGSGHLRRCINLARILNDKHQIYFLLTNTTHKLVQKLRKKYKIINFKNNKEILLKAKKNFKKKRK